MFTAVYCGIPEVWLVWPWSFADLQQPALYKFTWFWSIHSNNAVEKKLNLVTVYFCIPRAITSQHLRRLMLLLSRIITLWMHCFLMLGVCFLGGNAEIWNLPHSHITVKKSVRSTGISYVEVKLNTKFIVVNKPIIR